MRAAVLHEYGAVPVVEDASEPTGDDVVEVLAAGLNPIDLRVASGTLAARRPELPAVLGNEGIGRTADGRRVYFTGASFAERAEARDCVEVPDGIDAVDAVAYGVAGLAAWLALDRARVSKGDRVLVLGASGPVGAIALQMARLRGAGRVVAAARREVSGADASVVLGDDPSFDEEFDVVIDPLWGKPAAAAIAAMAFRGRLVQIGESAGADATLASADIRFKELEILGHTNFAHPLEERAAALRAMWGHAADGRLSVPCETFALDDIASAWERQSQSPGVKLVIVP